MNSFTNTRAAIVVYEESQPARTAAWECASTSAEIEEASDADYQALCAVQEAFWKDTQDINTRGHCALVDIGFIRRLLAYADKQAAAVANDHAQQWKDECKAKFEAAVQRSPASLYDDFKLTVIKLINPLKD